MKYLTRRFQKIMMKYRSLRNPESSNRAANANYKYHKCGKPLHFIRDCPLHKVEAKECQRTWREKDWKRNTVFDKKARKVAACYVVNKAFTFWGDSSSESDDSECPEDASMILVKDDENVFDGILFFMLKLND